MTPEEIDAKARQLIFGSRAADYGPAKVHFSEIARRASVRTGKKLTATDIVDIMITVKEVREMHKHKDDNLVDRRGYELLREIVESKDSK